MTSFKIEAASSNEGAAASSLATAEVATASRPQGTETEDEEAIALTELKLDANAVRPSLEPRVASTKTPPDTANAVLSMCTGACRLTWEQSSIVGTVFVLSKRGKEVATLCAACYASQKPTHCDDVTVTMRLAASIPSLGESSRDKLEAYADVVHRWTTDGPWIASILAFAPLAIPLLVLADHCQLSSAALPWPLGPLLDMWRNLRKWPMLVFGVYLAGVLAALIATSPFIAQVWFWAITEFYTVVFFVVYLVEPPTKNVSRWDALFKPVSAIYDVQKRLDDVDSDALLVHFAAAKREIDVTRLQFVAVDGTLIPSSHVAAAFVAPSIKRHVASRLAGPRCGILLAIIATLSYNTPFLLAWPSGANLITSMVPGVNGLVISPADTTYNVSWDVGYCNNVSSTASDAVVNFFISPPPDVGRPALTFGFTIETEMDVEFEILSSWNLQLQDEYRHNATVVLAKDQAALSFLARLSTSCTTLNATGLSWSIQYDHVSLKGFLAYVDKFLAMPGIVPSILAAKYVLQLVYITLLLIRSSLKIWSLWLHFDSITSMGFDCLQYGRATIALTDAGNIESWFTLRNGVAATTTFIVEFSTVFIQCAMLQFGWTSTVVLIYCVTGSAPLPTYFLLLTGLVGSLSPLAMLVPLAAALDIQRDHGAMLRTHLLRLEFERRRAVLNGTDAGFEERIARFQTIIDAVDNHDARMTFLWIEISLARLATVGATLASLVSYIALHPVRFTWAGLNIYNWMQRQMWANSLDPSSNTPQAVNGVIFN
ncbi:hypothetical protein SPRG_12031 [Saprolegnia parasitica CBS 223.65]|uniref:Uncharacterized protein n=1 Tax=Saprolegnia parasitica (strain CBS 223.65) TaxID=695850 RepID=A0A067BWI3_SAPPC|nr:hypothetical protein SPRG_12031 [Saprolegnia parasitica CBS 223.65]KDO22894.1 hypothetical protein SPRG_12031 [Saprolegnia parasitica CBS 223.65]|eukprot:XP_012206449.1 hypothetical protein SPRG_12031 [Saprolegnia parasitica CBS 223.65]